MHTLGHALKLDLEDVQRLDLEVYGDNAYSYMMLRQLLDIAGELFRICKDSQGNVIAYGVIAPSVSRGSGWLLSLAVNLSHRRKGIGTALVSQLLDKANFSALEKVYLTVAPGNDAAVSLYERLGFTTAKVEHHYFGRNEDRIVMCRLLSV
ncbi:MAG: GNAT family N-acetyltransferase [Pseudonocardiaceae bacterium]